LRLTIEKLIYGADGLAHLPADERGRGKAVFVPFVLPGEVVDVAVLEEKPGFVRAWVEKIVLPSAERARPGCRYFQHCGGCHYQHLKYEHQLATKAEILKENLRRIAKLELQSELRVHPSPPWNYRNRIRLRIQQGPEFALGYYRFGSHELLAVEECPISSPLINRAISALWKLGRAGMRPRVGEMEFFVDAEDSQVLVEVSCAVESGRQSTTSRDKKSTIVEHAKEHEGKALAKWAMALKDALPELAGVVLVADSRSLLALVRRPLQQAQTAANVRPRQQDGRQTLYGVDHLTYRTQRASYRVGAGSFFQVNRYLTDEMVNIVCNGNSGRTAVDLYAGVGLFSVVLSRGFRHIEAVESSPSSFADLQYNSPENVKAVCTSVAQYLQANAGRLQPDLLVVDPPRGGLGGTVVRDLVRLRAHRITYVSCDPATLARDLKELLGTGYRIEQAHLVDLFPQTYHLESVLQLVL
jgi:23S rRNA (uracil1939-C5)-methyltransferase